jgi:uncharacterized protein with PIN domain
MIGDVMFFKSKKYKEKKENEARLMRINNFEVRYVTTRDPNKYGETIKCNDKIIFTHSIENLQCSELMSQEGAILSYIDVETGENVEVMAYYKYHRK